MRNLMSDQIKHKSAALASAAIPKVSFDPKNKKHLASLKLFLDTGKWGDVRFVAELPHVEVPATCLHKLAAHVLRKVEAK
jgi:hypothetical protein